MNIERLRMELAGLASPADSQLVSSSTDPSPAKYDWSPVGGTSPATTPTSCKQTPLDIACAATLARFQQSAYDAEGATKRKKKAAQGAPRPSLEASPIIRERAGSNNSPQRHSDFTQLLMNQMQEEERAGPSAKKRKRKQTRRAMGLGYTPTKVKQPAPFPMNLSVTPEPVSEVPAIPQPILPLKPLVLGSPSTPPPSQWRRELGVASNSTMIEVPVFPQPILPLSDDPFYLPPPTASPPVQPVPKPAPAAVSLPVDQPEIIEISSDEDDEAPPAKRVRGRAPSVISVIYSEDGFESNSSNKENVALGKAESSPPPYVVIPYPPKKIIERPQPVSTRVSALSIADKFRAIVSHNTNSKSASQLVVPSSDDPARANAVANALFLKLIQNVPSNVLEETVVKMKDELVQRGQGVDTIKKENVGDGDDVKFTPEDVAKREDGSDAEDADDASSLFSRAASSESWEADVLISNSTPFADIYTNETERLPRAPVGTAGSLNVRARWELRVTIWYRHDLPPCVKSIEFDCASGPFRLAEKWVTRRVFDGNNLTRVEVYNRETARWDLRDIHDTFIVSMLENHTLLIRLPFAGKLVGFAEQAMLAQGTCLTVDHTQHVPTSVKGKARAE
ncbi:hypothetical protein C8T65DRAFT_751419 [Cerioporus squamosus]|nr:hypothetical protein C8T65DRAFT_751419 [Cerioporus squamosus]